MFAARLATVTAGFAKWNVRTWPERMTCWTIAVQHVAQRTVRHEERADVGLDHVVDAAGQQAQRLEALQVRPVRQPGQQKRSEGCKGLLSGLRGRSQLDGLAKQADPLCS